MRTALAAAVLLLWALHDVSPSLYRPGETIDSDVVASGEMLLHRLDYRATTANYHLPLSSVTAALLLGHSPPGAGAAWREVSAAAAFVLLLALGCELGAPWLGLAGAGLLLFVSRFPLSVQLTESWHGHWGHLQAFFTLIVLAAAALMARHLRAPSRAGAWAVALALGAALLYRSTLVFFPPLLAALYALSLGRRPTREDRRAIAVVALVPYMFLLPWIAANWAVHRRFIPLEDGEAAPIIVGGVLGAVEKEWARPPAALGVAVTGTGEALAWAVRRAAEHPAAYLEGYVRRLYFILLLNPLLFVFAGLSFWFHRRRREFQGLALLCAYWVLAHACMSMLREYFDPLWPLLAAAAGAGLSPFLAEAHAPPPRAREASGAALHAFLGVNLALSLFAAGAAGAYALAVSRDGPREARARLDAAIARHPRESRLYFERAMRRLESGGPVAEAEPDLRTAAGLAPGDPLAAGMLAWAGLDRRAAAGDAAAGDRLVRELLATKARPAAFLDRACARVRAHPALAPECRERFLARAEAAEAGREEVLAALDAAGRLAPEPPQRRRMARLYRGLKEHALAQSQLAAPAEAEPRSAGLSVERADLALRAGDPDAALAFLDEARALGPGPAELARIDELDRSVRLRAPAPEDLARQSRDAERELRAARAADLAGSAAARGDAAAAAALLAQARALRPSPGLASRLAAIESGMKDRAAERSLRRAEEAAKAGDRAAALAGLESALRREPDAAARRRAALLCAALGERARAAALFDGLIRDEPSDPGLRVERAALSAAAGDRAAALAALDAAGRLGPGSADRRRMAYLRQDLGDPAGALALFDGLVRESPKDASLRGDLGLCLRLNGRRADAIAELEKALALEPGLKAAASTLAAIRAER